MRTIILYQFIILWIISKILEIVLYIWIWCNMCWKWANLGKAKSHKMNEEMEDNRQSQADSTCNFSFLWWNKLRQRGKWQRIVSVYWERALGYFTFLLLGLMEGKYCRSYKLIFYVTVIYGVLQFALTHSLVSHVFILLFSQTCINTHVNMHICIHIPLPHIHLLATC